MMFRGGGCCGGHSQGGNDHSGHSNTGNSGGGGCCGGNDHSGQDHMGHDGENGQFAPVQTNSQVETVLDPVCGMHVNPGTAIQQRIDGKMYYFCSESCRSNFVKKQ